MRETHFRAPAFFCDDYTHKCDSNFAYPAAALASVQFYRYGTGCYFEGSVSFFTDSRSTIAGFISI